MTVAVLSLVAEHLGLPPSLQREDVFVNEFDDAVTDLLEFSLLSRRTSLCMQDGLHAFATEYAAKAANLFAAQSRLRSTLHRNTQIPSMKRRPSPTNGSG